jgi:hypothetical protein
MAHRKPLGTTCHSVCDWAGDLPVLNDALVSQAGTWYRIIGVEEKRNPAKVGLLLERVAEPEVFTDGTVRWPDACVGIAHDFEWYPRDKKRVAA